MTNLTDIRSSVASAAGIGTTVYNSVSALPSTGLTSGDQAFVESAGASGQSRLYVSNGSGWYNVALINATPRLTLSSEGSIALSSDGTATTITMTALDSDNASANLTLSIESGGDLFKFATVSRDSSVVTITPRSEDSATTLGYDGSATLTFKATDGISIGSVVNTFTLSFGPDWTQTPTEQAKLDPADLAAGDAFGGFESVAISGDGQYAVVGAYAQGSNYGAAYVFLRTGSSWAQQAKIMPSSDIGNSHYYGKSVAINNDGTYVAVGSQGANSGKGAAFIFTRSGTSWSQQAKLTASNGAAGNTFSDTLAFTPDASRIVVCDATDDTGTGGSNSGSGYVYSRSGTSWTEEAILNTHTDSTVLQAGRSCDISTNGDYILIGGKFSQNAPYEYAGAAYVWTRSGTSWSFQTVIHASDKNTNDFFGTFAALSADATVAAIGAQSSGGHGGAAYIFTRSGSTWSQQAKITASDATNGDGFGKQGDMSTDGKYVAVGTHNSNSSYVFENTSGSTWTQRQILTSSDTQSGDNFGHAISISSDGSYVIVGAPGEDGGSGDPTSASGAAYIFKA